MTRTSSDVAEEAIRRLRARVTSPRVRVLALLLDEARALTHQEIEDRLRRGHGVDRVTIYRVLEWLVKNGLAHRIQTGDRAWRFDAVDPEHAHKHAHFQCGRCGTVTCLEGYAGISDVKLPAGFRSDEVELTVKGTCAGCKPGRREAARGSRSGRAH